MIASFSIIHLEKPVDERMNYGGTIFLIRPQSKLNVEYSRDLWTCIKTMIDGGTVKLVVDMGDISFIDSSGIGTLIVTAKKVRQKSGDIAVIGVSQDILSILDMVSFRKFISIFESEEEAIQFFRNMP